MNPSLDPPTKKKPTTIEANCSTVGEVVVNYIQYRTFSSAGPKNGFKYKYGPEAQQIPTAATNIGSPQKTNRFQDLLVRVDCWHRLLGKVRFWR